MLAAVILIVLIPSIVLVAYILVSMGLVRQARRDAYLRPLSDREIVDALKPYGADISISPARDPRTGTTPNPVE